MQHAIGAHALLADGRTAALIDPAGNVAWMCWPRVDSPPLLMQLLDSRRGGEFSVRPVRPDAGVISRRYHPGTLVLETVWAVGRGRVVVDDMLLLDGPPRLARRVRSDGEPVDIEVRFQPAMDARVAAIAVGVPAQWSHRSGVRVGRFVVDTAPAVVVLQDAHTRNHTTAGDVDETLRAWQRIAPDPRSFSLSGVAGALGETAVRELLVASACVLIGLRQRDGGIVAAPTTSLPQWPGTQRTWDYRYCWMRDAALAAIALLRLGLVDAAHSLAAFLGEIGQRDEPPAVVRVDGSAPPEEHRLDDLEGYRGARPVRIGNAAARQLQIDIAGELTQLARALADLDALPAGLAIACARIAGWAAAHWDEPDHGIWEIRGAPRLYTHSRVMAWTALRDAVHLARSKRLYGDWESWQRTADAIHARVLRPGRALQLTGTGGGPDAALSRLPLVGFLPPDHEVTRETLGAIASSLDRNGLLDRCLPEQEAFPEPCGPFLFPTFWMASALERTGTSGLRYFSSALACRGSLGLLGEVADPETKSSLGNFPQVQSHASFILTATEG